MKHNPYLIWNCFLGLFFAASVGRAARASSLILAKPKTNVANTTVSEDESGSSPPSGTGLALNETLPVGNVTKLTGVPQIDYVLDPNLPRELNGLNLTDYPFYNSIPEEIDFKCDGLHDGFYASVPHKCQVYHHCLFGTRYDFLCANYTAFDQKTFICHFASEVDCKNSPKFFKRNEALYKAQSTTTVAPPTVISKPTQKDVSSRRRRPSRRRKPSYNYYDDYDDYPEDYEDGDDHRNKKPKSSSKESEGESEEALPTAPNKALYDRPRVAPKIRRPVPVNEREKYDYNGDSRLIPSKALKEESSVDDDEKTDSSKRKNKPKNQDVPIEAKGKDRDRERYRERDRERFRERDEDQEYEREKERFHDVEERERIHSREDDRDPDRERPRNRRPSKKRKRPDPYDYYDDYEEVRRPRPRDRPRYDDDDYEEYDDRYYRKPLRNRDRDRFRERERDRDRERDRYRHKDEEIRSKMKSSEYDKPRYSDYDDEKEDDRPKKKEEKAQPKSRDRYEESRGRSRPEEDGEHLPRKQEKSTSTWEPEDGPQRSHSMKSGASSQEKNVNSQYSSEEELSAEKTKQLPEKSTGEGGRPRAGQYLKSKINPTTASPIQKSDLTPDDEPLPAPRPAYISPPASKSIKKIPELSTRKPAGFRRPTTLKYSDEQEEDEEREVITSKESSIENSDGSRSRISFIKKGTKSEDPHPFTARPTPDSVTENKDSSTYKFKVPYEEPATVEDLAPRAPKVPGIPVRKRPFLPSRGGDSTLLRGLTPVGAKAFTAPKLEETKKHPDTPAEYYSKERSNQQSSLPDLNKYPTGIEFRARVTANLGVEHSQLTPNVHEETSSQEEDYSGELTDEEIRQDDQVQNYDMQKSGTKRTDSAKHSIINTRGSVIPFEKSVVPLRPTLRPIDFSQLSLADVHAGVEQHTQVQESEESREQKYSSRVPQNFELKAPENPLSQEKLQQKSSFLQNGPQTFFSENPKFQTVTKSEQLRPRPTTVLNFNQGTHTVPLYPSSPLIKAGQGQVQVIHFQKNPPTEYSNPSSRRPVIKFLNQPIVGNLEDTDEYDVSINDALQPISSLQPRNAQTGQLTSLRAPTPAKRRLTTNHPSHFFQDDTKLNQRPGGQRHAESIVQPLFAQPPNPLLKSFNGNIYSSFAK